MRIHNKISIAQSLLAPSLRICHLLLSHSVSVSCLTYPLLFFSLTQTIRAVQPDVVVVELCQYRVSMLKMDESTLLREAKDINLDKVQQAIKQVRLSEKWELIMVVV